MSMQLINSKSIYVHECNVIVLLYKCNEKIRVGHKKFAV